MAAIVRLTFAFVKGNLVRARGSEPWALFPRAGAAFGVHEVGEDVVDPGEMAFAFGAEPGEDLGIEADADRHLAPHVAKAQPAGKLRGGERGMSE